MKTLLTVLATTLLLAPVATVAPASAEPTDYLPVTTAKVRAADPPAPNDITLGEVEVDPNFGMVRVVVHINRDPGQWVRRAITQLGVKDAAGACQPAVEIVTSNAAYNYNDDDTAVRRPGETTLPKEQDEIYNGRVMNGYRDYVPLLDGLVPNCGQNHITSASGRVLSSGPLTFAHRPVGQVALRMGPAEYAHPEQFPLNRPQPYSFTVDSKQQRAYDGKFTVAAPAGVTVKMGTGENGPAFDGYHVVNFDLTVSTPGWKRITIRATAGNADPVSQTFTVYGVGGRPPTPTGSLAGRRFASSKSWYDEVNGYGYPLRHSLWFLDKRFAYVGVPPQGKPTCTAAQVKPRSYTGCKRYWWNKESNVLQIGTWIGSVRGRTLRYYLPGSGKAYDFTHPIGTPPAGTRFRGTWRDDLHSSVFPVTVALTLRRDGTFRMKQVADRTTYTRGRYVVGANGRMTLRYRSGKRVVRTLAIGKNSRGKLDPHHTGIFLSLPHLPTEAKAAWLTPVR